MGNKFHEGHETFLFSSRDSFLFFVLFSDYFLFYIHGKKCIQLSKKDIELLIRIYENLLYSIESHLHFIPYSLLHLSHFDLT